MSFLSALEGGLFAIGQILRLPVMFALWICVLLTAYQFGLACVAFMRGLSRRGFEIKAWVNRGPVLAASAERRLALPRHLSDFLARVQLQAGQGSLQAGGLENVLAESEDAVRRSLDTARTLVKVGPSLGLLGTLIPMGASLAAMSSGDLEAMATHMTVAFTTTIVGIAVGTAAYCIVAWRQPDVNTTIRGQRYLAEVIANEAGLD